MISNRGLHCVTCAGCTAYSRANCATVFSPTRASNPTLALKAALCRFLFAFISLLFLIYSKPAKIETYLWSKNRGPAHIMTILKSIPFEMFNDSLRESNHRNPKGLPLAGAVLQRGISGGSPPTCKILKFVFQK